MSGKSGTDMNEEQKMFRIGVCALVGVMFLIVLLQVCYRTQHKSLKYTNDAIIETQKKIAVAQANFETLTNSGVLLSAVSMVVPNVEIIGFKKYTTIEDLPLRK